MERKEPIWFSTDKHTNKQICINTYTYTNKPTQIQICRYADTYADTNADTNANTNTSKVIKTQIAPI